MKNMLPCVGEGTSVDALCNKYERGMEKAEEEGVISKPKK
jgi:hypothetical protein